MVDLVLRHILPAAYAVLPPAMNSPSASAFLISVGLQESQFLQRRQRGGGPAKGFWQFERGGGVKGVMTHPKTKGPLMTALTDLRYASTLNQSAELHRILEHNDVVACVFARLLLWSVPGRLPTRHESDMAWEQYVDGWRPGKPHPETWAAYFIEAWHRVDQLQLETSET